MLFGSSYKPILQTMGIGNWDRAFKKFLCLNYGAIGNWELGLLKNQSPTVINKQSFGARFKSHQT
jgi:hypothetical protein